MQVFFFLPRIREQNHSFQNRFRGARYINIKPTYQNMEIVKSKNIQGYSTDKTKI